ncbi:hypothetical protein [Streptomyces sp. NBC_01276]|uniref:hypothetical protein n=1 Tax=Streptomyces sp. NBC_01276 TaxID=2903808 RepID=UPI00352C5F33
MDLQGTRGGLLASGAESGLQVAAYLRGQPVVEACAGCPCGAPRALLLPGMPRTGGSVTAFGHHGSGGSVALADRERGLSFALTRTRLVGPDNGTAQLLADAVRAGAGG